MAIDDPGTSESNAPAGGIASLIEGARAAVSEGISAQAIAQAKQGAESLKNAAAAGQVRITPEGFDILTKALDDCDSQLQQMNFSVVAVSRAPMLGTSPYAQTVAAHVQKGGTGDTRSADVVVQQLTAVFNDVRDALNKAKQAYEDNEHATVRKLSN